MQNAKWTAEDLQQEFGHCHNLEEIIRAVEAQFLENGEVVCEIRVNGMFLTEADEKRFANSGIDSIKDLEIRSQRPTELFADVTSSCIEWVAPLSENSLKLADMVRDGTLEQAQNDFSEFINGCKWLTDAVYLLKRNLHNYSKDAFSFDYLKPVEEKYSNALRGMVVAFEQKDYSQLADILEYELSSSLSDWKKVLKRLEGQIKSLKASSV